MKKTVYIGLLVLAIMGSTYGQKPVIELTFTAVNNTQHVVMDSIWIKNLTQNCDTMLYAPDTVLQLGFVGIETQSCLVENGFTLFQNHPNPVANQATIRIYVPNRDRVTITVSDITGKRLLAFSQVMDAGYHSFSFVPGKDRMYLLSATWRIHLQSIKMVCLNGNSRDSCSLTYTGQQGVPAALKSAEAVASFDFEPGDQLLYVAHSGALESGITDAPESNQDYIFQFATNIPCPGTPTVSYEGQVYNTIQVFSQCWLKENLNVGTQINGNQNQTNNGVIEKYCYGNNATYCQMYGGMYIWDELMQYTNVAGSQGICPAGWHVPTDEEWKILEGAVDSHYKIGNPIWNTTVYRGFDAGKNLKSTTGWAQAGNGLDLFGFTILPAGYWWQGNFSEITVDAILWTSSTNGSQPWFRGVASPSDQIARNTSSNGPIGLTVRCLKD
jgi:uncharacterized protein (TIGR02145 family)